MSNADGTNAQPLLCEQCGYDLRAHGPDDRCPECGLAVAESQRVRRQVRPRITPGLEGWVIVSLNFGLLAAPLLALGLSQASLIDRMLWFASIGLGPAFGFGFVCGVAWPHHVSWWSTAFAWPSVLGSVGFLIIARPVSIVGFVWVGLFLAMVAAGLAGGWSGARLRAILSPSEPPA